MLITFTYFTRKLAFFSHSVATILRLLLHCIYNNSRKEHLLLHQKIVRGTCYTLYLPTIYKGEKDALRTFHDGVIIIEKLVVFKLKEKRNTFLYCYYRYSSFSFPSSGKEREETLHFWKKFREHSTRCSPLELPVSRY